MMLWSRGGYSWGLGAYILVGMAVAATFSVGGRYVPFLGRWWYNTAVLFPLGYLFGRRETEVWMWMRGNYRRQAVCPVALFIVSFLLSIVLWVASSLALLEMVLESLSTICFTWGLLLFSLRRKVTSRLLGLYGGLTLELYLVHGFFVNLFHRPFFDMGTGIFTIGNPSAYILLVLVCATPLALLFKQVTKRLLGRGTSLLREPSRSRS